MLRPIREPDNNEYFACFGLIADSLSSRRVGVCLSLYYHPAHRHQPTPDTIGAQVAGLLPSILLPALSLFWIFFLWGLSQFVVPKQLVLVLFIHSPNGGNTESNIWDSRSPPGPRLTWHGLRVRAGGHAFTYGASLHGLAEWISLWVSLICRGYNDSLIPGLPGSLFASSCTSLARRLGSDRMEWRRAATNTTSSTKPSSSGTVSDFSS